MLWLTTGIPEEPIEGGQKAKVLAFNRDRGITNRKIFHFTTNLSRAGTVLSLKQQLRGAWVGSTMLQSLAAPGFSHEWYSDRDTHHATWTMPVGDSNVSVQYRAYFTGGDDDIEYVLHHTYGVQPSDANTLNVLAYNIYMRPHPLFINGQTHRTNQLPEQIRGYDVIVFSEAFDDPLRNRLLNSLRSSYPYATSILGGDGGIEQDGGVIIVSRWPIEAQDQIRFGNVCSSNDCLADKGVVYARINKQGRAYHIFGSHTQADPENRLIRERQFQIIRSFINSKNLPQEPVIIAGDLNVDRANETEYLAMLRVLNAADSQTIGPRYTFYPTINDLASGNKNEFLDYVLWSRGYLAPVSANNEVRLLRAPRGWKDIPSENERWDLSDHYPVYGRLTFPG